MGVEIERKFLVHTDRLPAFDRPTSSRFAQGYLSSSPVVRVRLEERAESPAVGWLTIKGGGQLRRDEFEYAIPADDARALLAMCGTRLAKMRHYVDHDGHRWEVDEFLDRHAGLWLAEIELDDPDEAFSRPAWLGDEVTLDARYSNAALAQRGRVP